MTMFRQERCGKNLPKKQRTISQFFCTTSPNTLPFLVNFIYSLSSNTAPVEFVSLLKSVPNLAALSRSWLPRQQYVGAIFESFSSTSFIFVVSGSPRLTISPQTAIKSGFCSLTAQKWLSAQVWATPYSSPESIIKLSWELWQLSRGVHWTPESNCT